MALMVAPDLTVATHLAISRPGEACPARGYDDRGSPNSILPMQRLSIARSLRLALVVLTVALALVAALGIASLYNARQRYENRLSATSSLATAGANLAGASVAEEEVLRDARGPSAAAAKRQMAGAYNGAATTATSLARGDPPSERLVQEQIAAERTARAAAARGSFSTAVTGPIARARSLAATLQTRQATRQARRESRPDPTPAARCCWSSSPGCWPWAARSR